MTRPVECPRCGGDGRIECDGENHNGYFTDRIECPTCKGNGIVWPDPVEDTWQCSRCGMKADGPEAAEACRDPYCSALFKEAE